MSSKTTTFAAQLQAYKTKIDEDISAYSQELLTVTYEQFGNYPQQAAQAYVELLGRGGKRIRGALTMHAYFMLGGEDEQVAVEAARAVEMLHAYILMIDDIQDRSSIRRGGPTAHVLLADYHRKQHLKSDPEHFGVSIALNGALFGMHSALNVITRLAAVHELRVAAIENVNRYFIATAHGQTMDIFNEVVETVDEEAVDKVLIWKTAFYTFMNPLELGALLAGGTQQDLDALRDYSLQAGRLFQITDDILGVFGDEKQLGKSPMDDIREGKRTVLTVKALELAPKADKYFLEQMLGNTQLTAAEFKKCRGIITDSGALAYSQKLADKSLFDAQKALDASASRWPGHYVDFLRDLTQSLKERKA